MSRIAADIVEAFEVAAGSGRDLVVGHRTLSRAAVVDRCGRLAAVFAGAGLRPGDRVVLCTADEVEHVVLFLCLLRCGLTAVVIDPAAPPARARVLLAAARPAAMLLDQALRQAWGVGAEHFVLEVAEAPRRTLFDKLLGRRSATPAGTYPALLQAVEPVALPEAVDPELDAYVLFTSGSTSAPKGVCVGHRALFAHLGTMVRHLGYDEHTRLLNGLPIHHADGLIHGAVCAMACGGVVIRPEQLDIQHLEGFLDAAYTHRATHLIAVPAVLALVERFGAEPEALAGLEFVVSSAGPLAAGLWERFEARFGVRVVNVYGLTETVMGGLFSGPDEASRRVGSLGRPVDCEVRVVGEDGVEVGADEVGELWLRGPGMFSGYLDDLEASAAALEGGWLRTGDLVRRDADGFVWLVGRASALIVTGGVNVHPEEVDEVLRGVPGVLEAVTFGVDDEVFGERVVSAVVPQPDAVLVEDALLAHCRDHLEREKVPSRVHVVLAPPRGASGKISVPDLRSALDVPATDAEGDLPSVVLELAARCFGAARGALSPTSSHQEVPGWDSLTHLDFVGALEARFDVALTAVEVMRIERIQDAIEVVSSRVGAAS